MSTSLLSVPDAMAAAVEHHRQGRFAEAADIYRRVLAAVPDHADALHLLGLTVLQHGDAGGGVDLLARAVVERPEVPNYRLSLANALRVLGRRAPALDALMPALVMSPQRPDAHVFRGTLLAALGRCEEAADSYRLALALDPALAEASYNLGNALQAVGQFGEAVTSYERALAHLPQGAPFHADIWANLATALFSQGRLADAIAAHRRGLEVRPGQPEIERTLLQWRNLEPDADPLVERAQREGWCRRHARGLSAAAPSFDHDRDPDRRLRIGYVAGPTLFASTHALTVLPMMEAHDRAAVEIVIYSDLLPDRADAYTAKYRAATAHWRDTAGLDDAAFAEKVRADRIDVLVDIVGHLGGPRFLALAHRPAPVQIAAFVTGTSGLAAIDWALADPLLVPREHEAHFCEKILRVPLAYLYRPMYQAAPAAAPPSAAAGHVTFGSLNGLVKVTEPVIRLWARALLAVPGSRILVKGNAFSDAPERQRYLDMFRRCGIEPARVELRGWTRGFQDHLRVLDEIDIVLDSFPYSGVTTTCEALWMGAPVVTLVVGRACGRYGLTLLSAVGLGELAAATEDEFVAKAAALAADRPRLAELRRTLRARMAASPLCDARAFAGSVEAAYRQAWLAWCRP